MLLIFGHHLAASSDSAALKDGLDKIGVKFLFASHASSLDELVDYVIPVPVNAEKAGSLTNVDGRVQAFRPALDVYGDGVPEWKILLDLAKQLRVDHRYYWFLDSPEAVRRKLGKEIPFFE